MIDAIRRCFHRLHADRAGDFVQKILIIACIALPILIVLLVFRGEIGGWFKDRKSDIIQEGADKRMESQEAARWLIPLHLR